MRQIGPGFFPKSSNLIHTHAFVIFGPYTFVYPSVRCVPSIRRRSKENRSLKRRSGQGKSRRHDFCKTLLSEDKVIRRKDRDQCITVFPADMKKRMQDTRACVTIHRLNDNSFRRTLPELDLRVSEMRPVYDRQDIVSWYYAFRTINGMTEHRTRSGKRTVLLRSFVAVKPPGELLQPIAIAAGEDNSPCIVH